MSKLILASQSPRRASLLREAGYVFQQVKPPFDDPPQPTNDRRFDTQTLAMELASQKAISVAEMDANRLLEIVGEPGEVDEPTELIIIGADTICVGPGTNPNPHDALIGQPADRDHARSMIRSFINATHDVVSGVALLRGTLNRNGFELQQLGRFADLVPVTFGPLDDADLDSYLDTNQWQGKAGGYNLFDRQAAGWPIKLSPIDDSQPDRTSVVGLPMRKLQEMLTAWNVNPN